MTRMTRPDCAVMCNLINTHTHARTHTHTQHGKEGTPVIDYADARGLGERYSGRTEPKPIR